MLLESLIIVGSIVIFFSLVIVGWSILTYNTFVALRQDMNTQWSNIKTEYQRRVDLFYNLIESVKSFKKHERGTLKEVVQARSSGFTGTKSSDVKKMQGLDALFGKLAVVFERYPDLKANEQHNKLMDELRVTEDRINVSRTGYNSIVRSYNIYVKRFPSNLIAGMFKYVVEKFYLNEPETDKAPKIDLS